MRLDVEIETLAIHCHKNKTKVKGEFREANLVLATIVAVLSKKKKTNIRVLLLKLESCTFCVQYMFHFLSFVTFQDRNQNSLSHLNIKTRD